MTDAVRSWGETFEAAAQVPKERPILFSGAMVCAILAGKKTQTRRIVKFGAGRGVGYHRDVDAWHDNGDGTWDGGAHVEGSSATMIRLRCPYGQAGDRLWVREAWTAQPAIGVSGICSGKTLLHIWHRAAHEDLKDVRWRPSIHMPKWASRIMLEVASVRVERLQSISEDDARAEGVKRAFIGGGMTLTSKHGECINGSHRDGFAVKWDEIHGARAWLENPWVWVISFRRVAP